MKTNLISRLLKKRGIEKVEDLTPEERTDIERWQAILEGQELTVEKIKDFCLSQVKLIEGKIADGLNRPTDVQLASLHVYLNVLKAIEAPEAERQNIEKYLLNLINS